MKPRKWTADEKLAIVMEGLKEKRPVAEICREHQISQTLYYRWRDKFLEAGKKGLINGASDDNVYKVEIEKLQRIIGKQSIQIEILKKNRGAVREKVEAVRVLKGSGYTIRDACEVLGISRSCYYYSLRQKIKEQKEDIRDDRVLEKIKSLKADHPFWGYRRVWAWLRYREDILINQKRVRRLMKENGLMAHQTIHRAKRTPQRNKPRAERPREYFGIDMTKFLISSVGWVYLVIVLDWFTKKIVGWNLSLRSKASD